MQHKFRWDPCIIHQNSTEVSNFISDYFDIKKKTLFIAGAGFDPRSTLIANEFNIYAKGSSTALLIREERPSPPPSLLELANQSSANIVPLFNTSFPIDVEILSNDGAIIGGRSIVSKLKSFAFDQFTDVIVDISALSVGISFPIVKFLVLLYEQKKLSANLHIFVAHAPELDGQITSTPSRSPNYIHGFSGGLGRDSARNSIVLWLPQMSIGKRESLMQLHDFVAPQDTCPIIPFPARDPRLGDKIMEAFLTEFESSWSVDTRDIMYAAEDDPIGLYRTILELDDLRKPVFAAMGGSTLVLSPVGSKLMALSGLLASLERDLPVAYLESMGYNFTPVEQSLSSFYHFWLEGDVYPKDRPPLQSYKLRA
jgi:hypothetical protein